jgi:hypothetical protein
MNPKMLEALDKAVEELTNMPEEDFRKVLEECRFHSFMEDVITGKTTPDKIDDAIGGWHQTMGHYWFEEISLEDWLGITKEEYLRWLEKTVTFEDLARKRGWTG